MFTTTKEGERLMICDVCLGGTLDEGSIRFCGGSLIYEGGVNPPCVAPKMMCIGCECEECEVIE